MQANRRRITADLSDVLDRIMDRGIVIRAETSLEQVGLAPSEKGSRIELTSLEIHLEYADLFLDSTPATWQPHPTVAGSPAGGSGRDGAGFRRGRRTG